MGFGLQLEFLKSNRAEAILTFLKKKVMKHSTKVVEDLTFWR